MSTSDQSKPHDRRDDPYNGYSNYDTWSIALWRYNLQSYQTKYERLVRSGADQGPDYWLDSRREDVWQEIKLLYREIWEQAAKRDGCRWLKVDWKQLKEHYLEHVSRVVL